MRPDALSAPRWNEALGWMMSSAATMSQTHNSPCSRSFMILSRVSSERALNTLMSSSMFSLRLPRTLQFRPDDFLHLLQAGERLARVFDLSVDDEARRRKNSVHGDLPDVGDLLYLCLYAEFLDGIFRQLLHFGAVCAARTKYFDFHIRSSYKIALNR